MRNKIITRGILFVLCSGVLFLNGFESHAKEVSGEQTVSQKELQNGKTSYSNEITMMDEEGNIFVIGDTDGVVESSGIAMFSRTSPVQVVNFNTKNDAVTEYKEYKTGASGYTNGDYGADAAYLGTENGKVKFMLSGVVGLVSESEVQLVNLTDVKAVSYYIVQNGRLWHRIVHNMNQTGYISALDQGAAPSYLEAGKEYYSYDGHYFYADYAEMLDDYMIETRKNAVNASSPHYNYYQYLPLRSKMIYSESEIKALVNARLSKGSKMENTASDFIKHQNTYGVNALLLTGIGANESSWGLSNICKEKNNLFGINAVDSSPGASANTFSSVSDCIRQFAETYMSKRYLNPSYSYYRGAFLGNKASGINVSYASDPYWGEKAANVAWTLDKSGGKKDSGAYTIGIKDTIATDHNNVSVRSGSSASSTALYKTGTWTSYAVLLQKDTAENGFYKIQSDGVLEAGRTKLDSSSGKYDISSMYAYISDDYIAIVHKGGNIVSQQPENPDTPDTPDQPVTYTKYKTTTTVNYRTGPGTSYSKGGSLSSGTTVEIEDGYSKNANGYTWYRFRLNGKDYYIASDYVKKTDVTSLAKPGLVSAKYSDGAVTFTWKKVAGAEGYYVYHKENGGNWKRIATVKSGTTVSFKDKDIKAGNEYAYTVRAYKGSSYSGYNSGVSVKIPANKTYAKYKTTTKVNYRTGPGTSYSKGGSLSSGTTVEIEDGYSKNANGYTWYRFRLNGKDYYIASDYVKKTDITSLAKPGLVSAKYSDGAVTFTWKKVAGAEGYYVYHKENGGNWKRIATVKSGTTVSFKDKDIKAGNEYAYTVRAYKGSSYSGYNSGVSVKIPTSKKYTKYKTTTGVNYRTGPGTSYSKGGTLTSGTIIQVEDGYSKSANGYTWYRFRLNSKDYYVASKYLKKR